MGRKTRKALLTGAAAVAIFGAASGPAWAQTNVAVDAVDCSALFCDETTHVARTSFQAQGELVNVCDLSADGERAGGSVTAYWGGNRHYWETWDTDGDNGVCKTVRLNIPEGTRVTVKSWTQDGVGGAHHHEATSSAGVA